MNTRILRYLLVFLTLSLNTGANAHWDTPLPNPSTDEDFHEITFANAEKVELGKLLFFDKILSGNKNISCATCHHPFSATADGLSLPVGEGARGVSTARDTGSGKHAVHERVPRNAPAIFNLGAKEFQVMFHDGRVQINSDHPSGFDSPAGENLPTGLESILAAQAMFPVTSGTEMAGQAGENTIADAAAQNRLAGPGGVWQQLAQRIQSIPEYITRFQKAFPEISTPSEISFVHVANAIAAFEAAQWRADNSPFDQYLRGDHEAITMKAFRGMRLFYGRAGCASCHSGPFQTDHQFHSIAMPQVGPGKGDGIDGREDFGRERVTKDAHDRYRFRTPSLRNTALTGPWGHAGTYASMESVIRHHLNPVESLFAYNASQTRMPGRDDLDQEDLKVQSDLSRLSAIARTSELGVSTLTDEEIGHLIAFLHSLTDLSSEDLRNDVPYTAPSGLTVFD